MSTTTTQKPPIWFWIIGVIGLVWNAMGVYHYLIQAYNTEGFREMYTQEQLDIVANTPSWVTAAFAIAVFAGLLGFIFILLRKKLGYTLLLLSLIAVAVQMSYILINGYQSDLGMTIMIIAFAILFVILARMFKQKGWIS